MSKYYKCVVLAISAFSITILFVNQFNMSKQLIYTRKVQKFHSSPVRRRLMSIQKEFRITNLGGHYACKAFTNTMQLDKGLSPKDAIYAISKFDMKHRDLLNSEDENPDNWLDIYNVGRLCFRFVSFTIQTSEIPTLVKVFPMHQKYIVNETDEYSTVIVGEEAVSYSIDNKTECDFDKNSIAKDKLKFNTDVEKYFSKFKNVTEDYKPQVEAKKKQMKEALGKIKDQPEESQEAVDISSDIEDEDHDVVESIQKVDELIDLALNTNEKTQYEKQVQRGAVRCIKKFVEDLEDLEQMWKEQQ